MGIRGTHSNLKDKENNYKFSSTLTKLIWDIQSGLRLDTLLHKSGVANPNFLVNANFKNPVIINGVGSTNVGGKQPIDKWSYNRVGDVLGSVIVNKSFLTLSSKVGSRRNYLLTTVETPNAYNNETITVSMKYKAVGDTSDTCVLAQLIVGGVKKTIKLGNLICDNLWHTFTATYKISELGVITSFTPILIDISACNTIQDPNAYSWGVLSENGALVSGDTKIDIQWVKAELAESATPFKPRLYQEEYSMIYTNQYIRNLLGVTDISAIGDGTVTNALSTLNGNLVGNVTYKSFIVDTDLNTLVKEGFYSIRIDKAVNRPIDGGTSHVVLIVIPVLNSVSYTIQIAIQSNRMFMRSSNNNVWSDWIEMATTQTTI